MSQDDPDDKRALRASYNRVAAQYADAFFDELAHKPFDRGLLDRFAARVRGQVPVWDIGTGPGHVARYLHDHGVEASGLDLSDEMVARARQLNPGMTFIQGTMLALPTGDATLAGITAFYSIIHLSRAEVPTALREFHRALRPGGQLLLAFHGGAGEVHRDEWFGEPVDVHATFFTGDEMAGYATGAGFALVERHERPPYDFEFQSQRVYVWVERSDR
ncbi:MAG TPA: methyltransferase domain-containing protein [Ktedonobacterales bacterium]|jgi:SAM-dependent methyltransferase